MALVIAIGRQHFQDAARNIDRRRIEHGIVVGERNVLEHHFIVVFVERGPAAVLALHRQDPVHGALHRFALVASIRVLDPAQPQTHHCGVINVGVELIVKLEVPASRLPAPVLYFPIASLADLLLQRPVGGFHHSRIIRGHSTFAESEHGISGVPHR